MSDFLAILFVLGLAFFFLAPRTSAAYLAAYGRFPVGLAFLKFAVLPTFGEMFILRCKTGRYVTREFGLIPRAVVWGLLGVAIYFAFAVFVMGTEQLLGGVRGGGGPIVLLAAFLASFFMNVTFGPVLMIAHNLADRFIAENRGRFPIRDFSASSLLARVDWDMMWNFILKKTIPLFWIPVHTLTFLLPSEYRILLSAALSVVLGVILSFAGAKSREARAT